MNFLVFDIGGTNTKFFYYKKDFLIESNYSKTIKNNSLIKFLIQKTLEIMKKYDFERFDGIAISAPGYLERENLLLSAPTNLPNIRNLDIKPLKKFSKKLILEHDSDCAAWGAYILEKKIPKNLACITLGTGVGCGLIFDGRIYRGNKVGCEFGHTTIDIHGKKDNSGNYGTIENYLSIKGLKKLIEKKGLKTNIFELREKASRGDKKALEIYNDYSKYLATAIVNLANTLDLDFIYLTGGLVNAKNFFLDKAIKNAKKRFFTRVNPVIKATSENLSSKGCLDLLKSKPCG